MIYAGYEGNDHFRKNTKPANVGHVTFLHDANSNDSNASYIILVLCYFLHIPLDSQKKAFDCLNTAQKFAERKSFMIYGGLLIF